MHITCNRELLQKYISHADKVTGKNLSLPILSSILLSTNKKTLIIRATNLEVGVEFQIAAEIKTEGSIAVPGSLLANILASIPDEELITLQALNGVCKITTKTKNLTIKGFLPDDYPTIPIIKDGENFSIPIHKFTQGVKSVLMSAAISDIKPEISSVYITQNQNDLIFVATDSFRLAEKKIKHNDVKLSQSIIMPVKNVMEFIRIFEGSTEEVVFMVTKNQISCVGKSTYVTSRVIQGVYPDYEQIIPKNHTTEVVILKQDLINSLKLSNLFSDKFNKITFSINVADKICKISTKNTDVGEIESHLTASISGDPLEISLNGKHIFDCLGVIEKDSISIEFNGFNKPAVIRGLGDPSFTYLTMPLTR